MSIANRHIARAAALFDPDGLDDGGNVDDGQEVSAEKKSTLADLQKRIALLEKKLAKQAKSAPAGGGGGAGKGGRGKCAKPGPTLDRPPMFLTLMKGPKKQKALRIWKYVMDKYGPTSICNQPPDRQWPAAVSIFKNAAKKRGLTLASAILLAEVKAAAAGMDYADDDEGVVLEAAPYAASRYMWLSYQGPTVLLKSKKGHKHTLHKGSVFGVRPASSAKGMMRVIVPELGKNIVFSLSETSANKLVSKSKPVSSGKVKMSAKPLIDHGEHITMTDEHGRVMSTVDAHLKYAPELWSAIEIMEQGWQQQKRTDKLSAKKAKVKGDRAQEVVGVLSQIMGSGGQAIHALREKGDKALKGYDDNAYKLLVGRLQGAATSIQKLASKAKRG